MLTLRNWTVSLGILLVTGACSGGPGPVDPVKLVVRASPAPIGGLTGLKLHYSRVEIVQSATLDDPPQVVNVGAEPGTFDLVAYPEVMPGFVGESAVNW